MSLGALGKIEALLGLDNTEFRNGLKDADQQLSKFSQSIAPVAAALTAAFAGSVASLAVFTKFSSAQTEAELKLASAIRGTGAAIDPERIKAYAAELQKVTKFGDETTISAAAMLATFGLTEDQLVSLLPRIQNLSALYGMDLSQAAMAMGKALTMGAGALSRYGVVLTEAEKKAYNMGTQTEKVAMLMKLLDKNTGPAAQMLANTASGAFQQLQNAAGDVAEQLGFIVDSPITAGLKGLTELATNLGNAISNTSEETKTLASKLVIGGVAVTGLLAGLTGIVALYPAIKGIVVTFGVMSSAFLAALPIIIAIGAGIVGLVMIIGSLKKAWDNNLFGMRDTTKNFVKAVKSLWFDMIKGVQNAWKKFSDGVTDLQLDAMAYIKGMSPEETYLMKQAFKAKPIELDIGEGIEGAFKAGKDILSTTIGDLKDTFKTGAGVIANALGVSGLSDKLSEAFKFSKVDTGVGSGGGGMSARSGGGGSTTASGGFTPQDVAEQTRKHQDYWAKVDQFNQVVSGALSNALGRAGDLGAIASNAMQAFQAGPMAGIISVGVDLLTRTKEFGQLMAAMNPILGQLMDVAGVLMGALKGVIVGFLPLVTLMLSFVKPILEALTPVFRIVFEVLRGVALVIAYIFKALGTVWNGIVGAIQKVLYGIDKAVSWLGIDAIGDLADSFDNLKVGMDGVNEAIDTLKNTSWDEATQAGETADQLGNAENEAADFSDAMKSVNEELTNIPAGFKVALSRFRATSPEYGSNLERAIDQSGLNPGGVTIQNVTFNGVTTAQGLWRELKTVIEQDNFNAGAGGGSSTDAGFDPGSWISG